VTYVAEMLRSAQLVRPSPPITPLSSNIDVDVVRIVHAVGPCSRADPHPESVPPIPYSPKPDEIIEKNVKIFTANLQRAFQKFLKENRQLPLWQPRSNLDQKTWNHITGLEIPMIASSSRLPSLLLHNLGRPSHDTQLAERVNKLFYPGLT
jgi:hypothetical protein